MIHHRSQNPQPIYCYIYDISFNITFDITASLREISAKGFTSYWQFSMICNEIYNIAAAVVDVFRGAILYGRRNPSLVSSNMALHPSSPNALMATTTLSQNFHRLCHEISNGMPYRCLPRSHQNMCGAILECCDWFRIWPWLYGWWIGWTNKNCVDIGSII